MPQPTKGSEPSWFGLPITVRNGRRRGQGRRELIDHLDRNRIGTRLLFAGNMTKQPLMEGADYRISGELGNTDIIMNDTFWIGVHPGLDDEMVDYMIERIRAFYKH